MLAAHINKRSANFFNPFAGRIFEPSDDNIKDAHEGVFVKQSFPWLNENLKRQHQILSWKEQPFIH